MLLSYFSWMFSELKSLNSSLQRSRYNDISSHNLKLKLIKVAKQVEIMMSKPKPL